MQAILATFKKKMKNSTNTITIYKLKQWCNQDLFSGGVQGHPRIKVVKQ